MSDIFRALMKALVSQFSPRMLWLAIWPFFLALVFWGGVGWAFRAEILDALSAFLDNIAVIDWIESGLAWIGLAGFKAFLAPFIFVALLIPVMVASALLIVAIIAMPVVVGHVSARDYADVERRKSGGMVVGVLNALWVTLVFGVGWLVTIPFWLIAPLAFLLPLFWWAWLNARIMRYDALAEHATAEERDVLIRRHGRAFFVLGVAVSLLNFVPPLFFFAPIYSALAFTHYGLHALRKLRMERVAAEPVRREPIDMGRVEVVGSDDDKVAPATLGQASEGGKP